MFYLTTHSTHFIYGYMTPWTTETACLGQSGSQTQRQPARERDVLLNDALNTFYLRLYDTLDQRNCLSRSVRYSNATSACEREREMFYLTTQSTHFIYGYMTLWTTETACHSQSGTQTQRQPARERNVLLNDALNTFYLQLYDTVDHRNCLSRSVRYSNATSACEREKCFT